MKPSLIHYGVSVYHWHYSFTFPHTRKLCWRGYLDL